MGCASSRPTNKDGLCSPSCIQVPFEDGHRRLYQLDTDSPCWFYEHVPTGETLVIDPSWSGNPKHGSIRNTAACIHAEPAGASSFDEGPDETQEHPPTLVKGIVITLPVGDRRCIENFNRDIPIYCASAPLHRQLKKQFSHRTVISLSSTTGTMVGTGWELIALSSTKGAECGVLFTSTELSEQVKEQTRLMDSHPTKSLVLLSMTNKLSFRQRSDTRTAVDHVSESERQFLQKSCGISHVLTTTRSSSSRRQSSSSGASCVHYFAEIEIP